MKKYTISLELHNLPIMANPWDYIHDFCDKNNLKNAEVIETFYNDSPAVRENVHIDFYAEEKTHDDLLGEMIIYQISNL